MTLEALAATSGVSATMLSEVERAVKNPTVKLAWQIARALDCSLTELLEEPPPPVRIVRAGQRGALADPETGIVRHGLAVELRRGRLELAWYDLPAGAGTGEMTPARRGVVEHVIGLSGALTLRVGELETAVLPGDNVTYGPQAVVEYRNEGAEPCRFLLLSDRGPAGATLP